MIHSFINKLDKAFRLQTVSAHCDIPCKIYDPHYAQVGALSVIRFMDLIAEISDKDELSAADHAQLIRLVREKEIHAAKVKNEITIIWGDYFKQPQFEKFPESHQLMHDILLAGSACKQNIEREKGLALMELVNEFATMFWATKDIDTYTATCPYPPSVETVYPKLS